MQSIEKWNVDVILDGEMIGWDNSTKSEPKFGHNKTFANAREDYLRHIGATDPRDYNFDTANTRDHVSRASTGFKQGKKIVIEKGKEIKTIAFAPGKSKHSSQLVIDVDDDDADMPGSFMWVKFVVFDIMYISGPDARKLIKSVGVDMEGDENDSLGGSILDLTLDVRKRILHRLIDPIDNFVEVSEPRAKRASHN